MRQLLDDIRASVGLDRRALALRSGVSKSTIYRIEGAQVDPSVGTLRELALAAGFDLDISLAPLSDVNAARAAREILAGPATGEKDKAVADWEARLHRWVPNGDPVEIARTAGVSSSLLKRAGATYLCGSVDELKIAAAASAGETSWILSGVSGIRRLNPDTDGPAAGPSVVYTADPHRLVRRLAHMALCRPEEADLIVVPYTADLDVDAFLDDGIRVVAPIQTLVDAFGIGGALADKAETIARSW
ncbi:helix-turn-helix domain-containing protein [Cryobacterium sp. TmT2-59]|uniref:Helix-turn-helix domain-containing protein n=1 Tax=Cryobacterium shii TaxID=1259235 RepID=A0AAQ2C6G5_9MICO|nr:MULTISPECIES: helix-turn-helix domain-containing protein [Cryobacterium]TFC47181.1 helix-turn-helix domain-containing protein [Cryobacterium shii]TFC89808.1 helix-turn-helix domain-containing protein [Cryobacterium sp. TmT2-59]